MERIQKLPMGCVRLGRETTKNTLRSASSINRLKAPRSAPYPEWHDKTAARRLRGRYATQPYIIAALMCGLILTHPYASLFDFHSIFVTVSHAAEFWNYLQGEIEPPPDADHRPCPVTRFHRPVKNGATEPLRERPRGPLDGRTPRRLVVP